MDYLSRRFSASSLYSLSTDSPPGTFMSADMPSGPRSPLDRHNSTISDSEYARRSKKYLELNDRLIELNVRAEFERFIPRPVVIGNQSSGKSSLVEALTGISLPRDSGTCTRCPLECKIDSKATSWSCQIFIRRTDEEGNVTTDLFCEDITQKVHVELNIRRAQAAVLSPHMDASNFQSMSDQALKSHLQHDPQVLQYSEDLVVIEVRDPNAADIRFIDLPGLIQVQTGPGQDQNMVERVRRLTERYIQGENTLIVIVLPATQDFENNQAVALARVADPNGDRTIGVLTKPDGLTEGDRGLGQLWTEVLDGRRHATPHGYFCVRLPSDQEREDRVTRDSVQQTAGNIFNTQRPWRNVRDRTRFGIPNLVRRVSQVSVDLIKRSIPILKSHVDDESRRTLCDLDCLPAVIQIQDRLDTEILTCIKDFEVAVKATIFGKRRKRFVQNDLATYAIFRAEIIATSPEFRPFEGPAGFLEDRPRCPTCIKVIPGSQTEARGLEVVRHRIKTSLTWELPGHTPFEATEQLILDYVNLWGQPIDKCFQKSAADFRHLLRSMLDEHFGGHQLLRQYIGELVAEKCDECVFEADIMLKKILQMEKNPLYTQHLDVLAAQRSEWRASFLDEVKLATREAAPLHECTILPRRAIIHRFEPEPEIIDPRPITWNVDEEIDMMAGVQAYFHIAHQRIIDNVPLTIEHELYQNFANKIYKALVDRVLQDTTDGRITTFEKLMAEDPGVSAERQRLQDRHDQLTRIKNTLEEHLV